MANKVRTRSFVWPTKPLMFLSAKRGFWAGAPLAGPMRSVLKEPLPRELFNYTSGRFLYNEKLRYGERRCFFNLEALCNTVSDALEQDISQLKSVRKIGEGGSFRVFDFLFQDGSSAIARLPYSSLLPLERGIASEAATLRFLHLNNLPVPRLLAWNASSDNDIGSAYMILAKAEGTELSRSWFTMEMRQRARTILSIVEYEKKLFDLTLPAYGSIYFKNDPTIARETAIELGASTGSENFVIGPSAEHLWYYAGRDDLGVSPGPWRTAAELINAIAQREIAWMKKFATPRQPRNSFFFQSQSTEPAEPQVHIDALDKFRALSLALIPKDDFLVRPLLRHPDLSPSNIFITGTKVTSMIDWQHATSLPLYLQALIPSHFQFYGDPMVTMVAKPSLPPDFESFSTAEQQIALETYRRRQCHIFYSASMGARNIDFFCAMNDPSVVLRGKLFDHGRSPWEGDNATLRDDLLTCADQWSDLHKQKSSDVGEAPRGDARSDEVNTQGRDGNSKTQSLTTETPRCPVSFTDKEREEIEALSRQSIAAEEDAQLAMEGIGISRDGWVAHENYDKAKEQEADLKRFMLQRAVSESEKRHITQNWPYLDHEEMP